MTAKQVIAAYEALPSDEKAEVLSHLTANGRADGSGEAARREQFVEAKKDIFTRYDKLFRRLAE